MIALSLKDDGTFIGTVDEADLQMLMDQLEEESEQDTDYYIDVATIDMLERNGASDRLITVLERPSATPTASTWSGARTVIVSTKPRPPTAAAVGYTGISKWKTLSFGPSDS